MPAVTVSRKYQVVIPKEIREEMKIEPGQQVPLADSIIYATARRLDAVLWTQDAYFKDLPGVKFFAR